VVEKLLSLITFFAAAKKVIPPPGRRLLNKKARKERRFERIREKPSNPQAQLKKPNQRSDTTC
jgi:hypothetical protein